MMMPSDEKASLAEYEEYLKEITNTGTTHGHDFERFDYPSWDSNMCPNESSPFDSLAVDDSKDVTPETSLEAALPTPPSSSPFQTSSIPESEQSKLNAC